MNLGGVCVILFVFDFNFVWEGICVFLFDFFCGFFSFGNGK